MDTEKQNGEKDIYTKAKPLAEKIMRYAADSILVNMRFMDVALSSMKPEAKQNLGGVASDGERIYYDPVFLLKSYKKEPACAIRLYLHVFFHFIFYHSFRNEKLDREKWNLAADMAVESAVLELTVPGSRLQKDEEMKRKLASLKQAVGSFTAEKIYRYLKESDVSDRELSELSSLFYGDSHMYWVQTEEFAVTAEQWKKLSERVQADLKSFSKGKNNSEGLEKNLAEAVKERYHYADLLRRFMVMSEDIQTNDDEFDYVYYTYGLSLYGNMPLVEPLEYRDSKKIKEFVIAIDTSASCRGCVVQSFLKKTYSIFREEENFFNKMNVHIIQCDSEVQKDAKITSLEDFEYFIAHERLAGFGSTDFRPVFNYVGELIDKKEFENLKGLIYFTDGYGIYPQGMPPYDVMFVFLSHGEEGPEVPPWAIKVLLEDEELED